MHHFSRRAFIGASLAGLGACQVSSSQTAAVETMPKGSEEAPFQPTMLFLTWQRDPTTTMTIQWVGSAGEASSTRIYYATTPTGAAVSISPQVKPYPKCELKIFRAELTELKPGTDYYFRIGSQSPLYRFRTMPAKATDTIHFISGGDCGVNAHTVANNIQAARQDPMFAVIGGDLGYDDGKSVATSLAFLKNYSKTMIGRDGRLIPMITCIGNHEVDGGFNKTREKAPFYYALFDGLYPEKGFATLDFGDYLSLVLLDTGHTTPIAGEQTDWLETTLKNRIDHPNVMVVNHVPAYPSYRNAKPVAPVLGKIGVGGTGEENRRHWVPLFDKYRVPVVLEHHDHTFKRTKPLIDGMSHDNGVLYLGDGSWGRLRTPNKPEKIPVMAKTSQDYHISLHRIEGEQRFHLALDENGKVMDVCRSGQRTKA